MSILNEIGGSVLKTQLWQVEAAQMALKASPIDVLSIPKTAVQELTGVSGDLQNFLLKRAFNFPQNRNDASNVQTKPTQPTEPTYPGAPLFSEGVGDSDAVDFDDVNQGNFGDCYLLASLASIAKNNPQAIRDMVTENRDASGNVTSYTVTFHEKQGGFLGIGDHYEDVEVTVSPSEIMTDGANPADNGEIWVKVVEAGFAKYKGGVDNIKNGGNPSDTMEILTGNESRTYQADPGFFDSSYSFDNMETDLGNGEEIVLSSKGDSKKMELSGYGIHGDHAYMVEKVYTDADGKQMVQLYNPWGHDHPKPIPFSELGKYFTEIGVN